MERKILIIDDEPSIRVMLQEAFNEEGYQSRAAESAEEALAILKEENYWVIFLDLNLPGMSGVELCRQIHHDLPMAIIHAVTGYASLYDLVECREAGFDDYFTKPVDLHTLFTAAEDAFNKLERWRAR